MASKPTQRTLKNLRDRGYLVDIGESYNAFSRKTKDLFGFIDVIALHPQETGVLGVQTTTGANLSARIKKAENLKSGAYWKWLGAKNDVEFHGWAKRGARGKRKLWTVRIVRVSWKDVL